MSLMENIKKYLGMNKQSANVTPLNKEYVEIVKNLFEKNKLLRNLKKISFSYFKDGIYTPIGNYKYLSGLFEEDLGSVPAIYYEDDDDFYSNYENGGNFKYKDKEYDLIPILYITGFLPINDNLPELIIYYCKQNEKFYFEHCSEYDKGNRTKFNYNKTNKLVDPKPKYRYPNLEFFEIPDLKKLLLDYFNANLKKDKKDKLLTKDLYDSFDEIIDNAKNDIEEYKDSVWNYGLYEQAKEKLKIFSEMKTKAEPDINKYLSDYISKINKL